MSAFDSNDPRDEALWQLLGKARQVEPSPYFARRVLRAIETESTSRPNWWQGFLRSFTPAAACAALAVTAVIGVLHPGTSPSPATAEIEFETIQNLDLLVSNYESSLWLDQSSPSSY